MISLNVSYYSDGKCLVYSSNQAVLSVSLAWKRSSNVNPFSSAIEVIILLTAWLDSGVVPFKRMRSLGIPSRE